MLPQMAAFLQELLLSAASFVFIIYLLLLYFLQKKCMPVELGQDFWPVDFGKEIVNDLLAPMALVIRCLFSFIIYWFIDFLLFLCFAKHGFFFCFGDRMPSMRAGFLFLIALPSAGADIFHIFLIQKIYIYL